MKKWYVIQRKIAWSTIIPLMLLSVMVTVYLPSCQKNDIILPENEEVVTLKNADVLVNEINALIEKIEGYAGTEMNEGIANSLISKLLNALKSIEKGQENAALNQLQSVINQVEDLISEGTIWGHIGDELINDVQSGISQNACGLTIGQDYLGGILAYILQPGDPGYDPDVCHGLIALPFDLEDASWGCAGVSTIDAWWNPIGDGMRNTIAHVENCAELGTAARLCFDVVYNEYDDWFLPSPMELRQLYINREKIGGFDQTENAIYWSSSEFLEVYAWYWNFYTNYNGWDTKDILHKVRPIRYF